MNLAQSSSCGNKPVGLGQVGLYGAWETGFDVVDGTNIGLCVVVGTVEPGYGGGGALGR